MMSWLTRATLVWLLLYLVLAAGLVLLMFRVRGEVLREFSTAEQRENWNTWREKAEEQSNVTSGPVVRRPPMSNEPPTLVLMRDYFAVCLAAVLVFGSILFFVLMFMVRGIAEGERSSGRRPTADGEK